MNPKNLQPRFELTLLIFALLFWPGTYLIHVPAIDNYFGYQDTGLEEFGNTFSSFDGNYTKHEPIFINFNSDFVVLGFNGSGTNDDPYRIEGLNITSSTGSLISISNTDAYFAIQNLLLNGLNGDFNAISLFNVKNGLIEGNIIFNVLQSGLVLESISNDNIVNNNTIYDTGAGIGLGGNNNTISNNHIHHTNTIAIFTAYSGSNNHTIKGNNIHHNGNWGISIENSNFNVVSENYLYDNIMSGIFLGGDTSTSHNLVYNNTIFHNNGGIGLGNADSNNITNNEIFNNSGQAIQLDNSHLNTVENNTLNNVNSGGIDLFSSNNNNINYNTISTSLTDFSGISMANSNQNLISENTIFQESFPSFDNGQTGIRSSQSNFNLFQKNEIYNIGFSGIQIEGIGGENVFYQNLLHGNKHGFVINADKNDLVENFIADNEYGFVITGQQNNFTKNRVQNNDVNFVDGDSNTFLNNLFFNNQNPNDPAGIKIGIEADGTNFTRNDFLNNANSYSQVHNEGTNTYFRGNYWSDWDGSNSYDIRGDVTTQDNLPRANPNHMTSLSVTISSNDLLILEGIIPISWNSVHDTFDHGVTYSVYYSANEGLVWISLQTQLTELTYNLDTSSIADGSNVLFKVHATDEVGFVTQTTTDETYLIANSLHELSLAVNSPSGIQSGTISLSWDDAIDTWNHQLVYDIYISSDAGDTWEILARDLVETSFEWDTTTVDNGEYLFKVVAKDIDGTSVEAFSLSFTIENIISMSSSSDTITTSTDLTTSSISETETSNPAPSDVNAVAMIFALMSIATINFTRKKYDSQKL